MALTRQEVLKVATLSRIRLSDGEEERFASQLSGILGYVNKLRQLDTEGVEPLAHALPIHNVLRKDEPRAGLSPEEALAGRRNRPATSSACPGSWMRKPARKMPITDLSACQLRNEIRQGRLSAAEAAEASLAAIARLDPKIKAFLAVDSDGARRRAAEIDRRLAAGEACGMLAGVPVAVKDNMCMANGLPTTCASKILGN